MTLKKVLTLRTVIATSAGLTLASSSFIAAVQLAVLAAGSLAWLAVLVGGVLCMGAALCFAELNNRFPSAAGIRLYLGRAFGDRLALTVTLVYMGVVLGVVGAESYVLAHVLADVMPRVQPSIWIAVMFIAVTALNIRGIKLAGGFQDLITYCLMAGLSVLALLALIRSGFTIPALHLMMDPGETSSYSDGLAGNSFLAFIQAVAVGVFLFVGFEWVTPLAEEVTEHRLIARGMLAALGILSVVYALLAVAMPALVPMAQLASSPAPQMLFAAALAGQKGRWLMLLLCLGASITTFNAGLISISRFIYASAREGVLPRFLSRISTRYFTPYNAILLVFVLGTAISLLILITRRYLLIVNLAAAMEAVVYVLAALAVPVVRRKYSSDLPVGASERMAGGSWLPLTVAAVFTLLTLAVISTSWQVGVFLCTLLAAGYFYVILVVPRLQAHYRAERVLRSRRRPAAGGKGTTGNR